MFHHQQQLLATLSTRCFLQTTVNDCSSTVGQFLDTVRTPRCKCTLFTTDPGFTVDLDLSPHLTIAVDGTENPFRVHVLPLAYQHTGVLHAVLGLSACHLHLSSSGAARVEMATALQHRVAALNILALLLGKEEVHGLTAAEDEAVLAIVLLLVLHDVSLLIQPSSTCWSPSLRYLVANGFVDDHVLSQS